MPDILPSTPKLLARLLRDMETALQIPADAFNAPVAVFNAPVAAGLGAISDEISGAANELEAAIAHDEAMMTAARAAKTRLRAAKKDAISSYRRARGKIKASDLDAGTKARAHVAGRKVYSRTSPHSPTELFALALTLGLVDLKWNRAGNKPGTFFDIEEKFEDEWRRVDSVTGIKAKVACPVGRHTLYRVSARNPQGTSPPSGAASVW